MLRKWRDNIMYPPKKENEKFIFCTEIDKRTGNIMLSPPRGEESIIIKSKDDVKVLTDYLMDCFQR